MNVLTSHEAGVRTQEIISEQSSVPSFWRRTMAGALALVLASDDGRSVQAQPGMPLVIPAAWAEKRLIPAMAERLKQVFQPSLDIEYLPYNIGPFMYQSQAHMQLHTQEEAAALLDKLGKGKGFAMMDDDNFFVREEGMGRVLQDELKAEAQRIYPFAPDFYTTMPPHTLEQKWRYKQAMRIFLVSNSSHPTIIPLSAEEHTLAALEKISTHSGMVVRFEDARHEARLADLKLDSTKNSFAEIVRAVCRHTGTVPHLLRSEHCVLELREEREPCELVIDDSGSLLGVHRSSGTDATLDIVADPAILIRALVSARSASHSGLLHVRVHPTISPQWHNKKKIDLPFGYEDDVVVGMPATPSVFPQDELVIELRTRFVPMTKDIPLHGMYEFPGGERVEVLDGEHNDIRLRISHPTEYKHDGPFPSFVHSSSVECLDADGRPLPTSVTGLRYGGTAYGFKFNMYLSTADKSRLHSVRFRGYAYHQEEPQQYRFSLPREQNVVKK